MAWAVAVGAVAAIFSPRGAVITCGPVSHHTEAWTVLKVERLYFRPLIGPRSSQALHSSQKVTTIFVLDPVRNHRRYRVTPCIGLPQFILC